MLCVRVWVFVYLRVCLFSSNIFVNNIYGPIPTHTYCIMFASTPNRNWSTIIFPFKMPAQNDVRQHRHRWWQPSYGDPDRIAAQMRPPLRCRALGRRHCRRICCPVMGNHSNQIRTSASETMDTSRRCDCPPCSSWQSIARHRPGPGCVRSRRTSATP